MYSMYFVFSYFICPVYCSIDTNACQYVRIKKLLLLLLYYYNSNTGMYTLLEYSHLSRYDYFLQIVMVFIFIGVWNQTLEHKWQPTTPHRTDFTSTLMVSTTSMLKFVNMSTSYINHSIK